MPDPIPDPVPEPILFEEAMRSLAARGILPTALDTAGIKKLGLEVTARAFFSACVEEGQFLQTMRDYLMDWQSKARMENGGLVAQGRAEFVADMRQLAIQSGMGRVDPATGAIKPEINDRDLRDIRSRRRLELIFDTQTEMAHEHGYWREGMDPDVLDVYPAQRFIRVREVQVPRPYHAAAEGMVRLKTDLDFWRSMNRDFGVPWGPWGYNSGMGVEDVDRMEAEALGLLKPGDLVLPPEAVDYNTGLQASMAGLDDDIAAAVARKSGGTIAGDALRARVFPRNTMLDPDLVEARIASLARPDAVDIALLAKLPSSMPAGAMMTLEDLRAALRAAGAVFPPGLLKGRKFEVETRKMNRATAGTYAKGKITLAEHLLSNPAEVRITLLHEVTHAIMDESPGAAMARRAIASHFGKRTRGEPVEDLRGMKIRRDRWWVPEAGKVDGTELASYYVELLGYPPRQIAGILATPEHRETMEVVMDALGLDWRNRQ